MKDAIIKVENVSKDFKLPHQKAGSVKNVFTNILSFGKSSFEVQHALRDINIEIKKGEFFGIVGRNGSGKSTMLKMLAGIYQPTKGSVSVGGRVVPFIELGVGFNGELTGRENIYLNGALLGFSEAEVEEKYADIVDFAQLEKFMDQKLKNYSSGMQVRLAFSVATRLAESDILLIDEVLAVGDVDFQRKCFRFFKKLKKEKKTVVFVTHDMGAIREYCDRAALIESSELVAVGKPGDIAKRYEKLLTPHDDNSINGYSDEDRWGDGTLSIGAPDSIEITDTEIKFSSEVTALSDCDDPVLGFSIRTPGGLSLMGSNTIMQKVKSKAMKKGETRTITWQIDNVLSEGNYYICLAAVYDSGSSVADWWDDVAEIGITRTVHSPYPVTPNIRCAVK